MLAGLQESLDTHIGWVDFTVHKLTPIVAVADWLLDPPRHRLPLPVAATWLAYPVAWFGYTVARGAAEGWYPNRSWMWTKVGYGGVVWRSAILAVAFARSPGVRSRR